MISEELQELITPHLKEWLAEEDYVNIPMFFEEAYLMDDKDNHKVVALGFGEEAPLLVFDVVTGEYRGVYLENYVRMHGVPL